MLRATCPIVAHFNCTPYMFLYSPSLCARCAPLHTANKNVSEENTELPMPYTRHPMTWLRYREAFNADRCIYCSRKLQSKSDFHRHITEGNATTCPHLSKFRRKLAKKAAQLRSRARGVTPETSTTEGDTSDVQEDEDVADAPIREYPWGFMGGNCFETGKRCS